MAHNLALVNSPHEKLNLPLSQLLPFEILRLIFLFVHASYHVNEHRVRDNTLLILSSICVYWRAVSLSVPGLWTQVTWDWREDGQGNLSSSTSLTRFRLFLARSGCAPLDVIFRVHTLGISRHGGPEVHERAWRILKDGHASRCRSLRLQTLPDNGFRFDMPLSRNFSSLETLDFDEPIDLQSHDLVSPNHSTPLTQLHIRQPIHSLQTFLRDVPVFLLESVTLSIGSDTMSTVLAFLAECPRLKNVNLGMRSSLRMESADPHHRPLRVTLPTVSDVCLMGLPPHALRCVLSVPRITHLVINIAHGDRRTETRPDFWFGRPREGSLAVSEGTLQELEIDCGVLGSYPSRSYLSRLILDNPSILRLRIKGWRDMWGFLVGRLPPSRAAGELDIRSDSLNMSLQLLEIVDCPFRESDGFDPSIHLRRVLLFHVDLRIVVWQRDAPAWANTMIRAVTEEFGERLVIISNND